MYQFVTEIVKMWEQRHSLRLSWEPNFLQLSFLLEPQHSLVGGLDLLKLVWRHIFFEEDEISVVKFLQLEVLFLMGVHECIDGLKVELRDRV